MLKVQRLWDAWMADSMLAAAADGAEGAVLIAGSGHVREDRAVPWHLGGRGGGDALTLALVEVAAGSLAARDEDRKSVGWGQSVSVRLDLGGRRIIQNKNH